MAEDDDDVLYVGAAPMPITIEGLLAGQIEFEAWDGTKWQEVPVNAVRILSLVVRSPGLISEGGSHAYETAIAEAIRRKLVRRRGGCLYPTEAGIAFDAAERIKQCP